MAGVRLPDLSVATRALLQARLQGRGRRDAPGPRSRDGIIPLSFAQERLYFLDRMQPGGAVYNVHAAVRLPGVLDVAALERALGEIVRRHEALRTTFRETGGVAAQIVAPFAGFALAVEELAGADEAAVRRRATAEAASPFDLGQGPLFRATLLRLGGDDHLLLLSMHHIVSDGWSLGVLRRELSALYDAYRAGRESPLAPLPLQYADYALWQREPARTEVLERELAWWRRQLAGVPGFLELPTDRPRPPAPSFGGGTVALRVGTERVDRLRELARSEGATLYMAVLAAFHLLLSRHSGSDDIVVGSPAAGRTHREVEELIGFFAKTLVLRTGLGGDPGFREVLRRVRETVLGAYEHQEVPFERLVAELQPERSPGHSPLFQVMFSLGGAEAEPLEAAEAGVEQTTAKFDLTLAFAPGAGGLDGVLEYSTDLFDPATAERMVAQLGRVLEQVAADPDVRLSQVELLGDAERRRLLHEWSRAESWYPRDRCVHALFQAQAERTPGATAVVHEGGSLTYRELNERANRLAHHLQRLGVGPEDRVGVCLERGAGMIVTLLAALKAGGAYVPLDPGYPAARLALMLADSAAVALVTQESLRGALPSMAALPVISVDGDAEAIAAGQDADPESGAAPDGLAYVVYTSGSTGTPKGVAVHHRAVARLVRDTDYVRLGPDDRMAQASTVSFDAATFEIWGALLNGGAVVCIPRDTILSPAHLAAAIAAHSVTVLFLTTAVFNQVAREIPDAFAPLRSLLFGGELVDPAMVRRVLDAGGPGRLLHVYGPTENTTFSSWHPVAAVPSGARNVPIGRAIAHSSLVVLDAALRPVPVGIPGELYVGGDGVARGYLGRPGLTAERFVPDPYAPRPGARMYRSGDRVRWLEGGAVEYLSRLDEQVKIRGLRIELGEIEAALNAHPAVREARVMVREDVPGEKRLVAYLAGGPGADADALRAHLRGTLPEYMLPAAFVTVDALPLNANGKLDRRALPAPEYGDTERYVAPRTPAEEVLTAIWAEVLGRERVGVHDGFFELGGHSLLATRMVSRIREALRVELPLRALFEGPTVAELAEAVQQLHRAGRPVLPPVVPVGRGGPLPLSFSQQRLWFLDRMRPGAAWYNVALGSRLSGPLHTAALEAALGEIVRRHETLRTVFAVEGDEPVQVIHPPAAFRMVRAELEGVGPEDREEAAREWMRRGTEAPFDLARGPLFRAELLRVDADDHLLLLAMHHVVSDGWSVGVLLRELDALYAAFVRGRPSPLPELAVQYADYAAWQRAHLRGDVLDEQIGWWRRQLQGAPTRLDLPTDRPRPPVPGYRGGHEAFHVPPETGRAVRALARRESATPFMALLAAFQVFLSRASGQADLLVGTPIAGRTRREVEPLIGFFINTLALRVDFGDDPSFSTVLARVREASLGAYAHQELPFERLVEALGVERDLSRSPLVQVMFALREAGDVGLSLDGVRVEPAGAGTGTARFDLMLTMVEGEDDAFTGVLEYAADLFDPETVARMGAQFRALLDAAVADPARLVSTLPLMDEAGRRRVLREWNATDKPFAEAGLSLPALVERQAARTPNAAALVFEGETLSYAALNARANRLARHLRRLGVKAESRVGVCAERSPELVVALLAVLKAGGAYVPLDPGYPAERLAYMLADSGVAAVLAQGRFASPVSSAGLLVRLEDEWEEDGSDLGISIDPAQLAYVIYTSGSTGWPKGAMNAHRGVANRLLWMQQAYGLTPDDVVLQKTPFGFDVSVWEFFWPLTTGARLVLARPEGHRDPAYLAGVIEHAGVTTCHFVPSMLSAFLEGVGAGRCPSLRRVVCSGEALPPALAGRFFAAFPHVEMHNLYGPTEAAVDVAAWRCSPADAERGVPIGRPIANTRTYVLDGRGSPLPAGVPGELYLAGVQVGRGYLGRPALTAERFVPDPFSGDAGARMYRTGDLARWTAAGALEYRGRTDFQVKLRGMRIEPGEIEAALLRHPGVREAAVVVRGEGEDARLAAYLAADGDAPTADALRDALRRHLPESMIPGDFMVLDAFPLTPNGKLDRARLPAPQPAGRTEALLAPGTALERTLSGVWREVLGRGEVDVRDNFFALGGHSLLLTRVHRRLAGDFPSLTLLALFEHPTIRTLAAHLEEGGGEAGLDDGVQRGTLRTDLRARRQQQMRRRQTATGPRE